MIAGMLTQLSLPLLPAAAEEITPGVGVPPGSPSAPTTPPHRAENPRGHGPHQLQRLLDAYLAEVVGLARTQAQAAGAGPPACHPAGPAAPAQGRRRATAGVACRRRRDRGVMPDHP